MKNVHQVVNIQNDGKNDKEAGILHHFDRAINRQDRVHNHLDKGHVHHGVIIGLFVSHYLKELPENLTPSISNSSLKNKFFCYLSQYKNWSSTLVINEM